MRFLVGLLTCLILAMVLAAGRGTPETRNLAAQDDSIPSDLWIKVVFGLDDEEAVWDGQVSVTGGELRDIDGWSFEARDQLDADAQSWKIRSGLITGRRATYAEPTRGVVLRLQATEQTHVAVVTEQGNFEFDPAALRAGQPQLQLDGRASVELMAGGELIARTTTDDDFASIAIDSRGHRHVMWVAFDEANQRDWLYVRDLDEPNAAPQSVFDAEEFDSPRLFVVKRGDGSETLRAVFCSPGKSANWDVYSAVKTAAGWVPERLTLSDGVELKVAANQSPDGALWVAWQTFENGQGDVVARRLNGGRWSNEFVLQSDADEWNPSVSAVNAETAWVGFDSYANGNYDVEVARLSADGDELSCPLQTAVSTSPDFEAHANVRADREGVWVAWNAAGENWGKDFRNGPMINDGVYSEPLHASRRLELRRVTNVGQVHSPVDPLPQLLPEERQVVIERSAKAKPSRFYEYPQLARDGDGRLWLAFRMCRQGNCAHPPMGIDWKIYATCFADGGWLTPIELPRSQGRQDQRVSLAVAPDGRLHAAWADGNRFASVNRKYSVYAGALPKISGAAVEPNFDGDAEMLDPPPAATGEPQVKLTMQKDGREYRVLFGDLHRHTNISRCMPTLDGCLEDAHRYALNAVQYDFLAITDHTRDVDPFSWWRTQKAADLYHVPARYVPIYAYERSNGTASGGHRNVFFQNRGAEVNPGDAWADGVGRSKPDTDPDTTLYPWLKDRGDALTAAHTPGWAKAAGKGTWTYNDPQVEPVAEIFQGFRRSYERPGSGVLEQASLWYALRKGHRLGFIASSDHMSTHMSFACVWATEKTREGIFEALRARRTYAATDRIGLAMQLGNVLMGEEAEVATDFVTLRIRVEGTAPVTELEVVRSGKVIHMDRPQQENVDFSFTDSEPLAGTSHYYVRLVQENGAIAWGSPIWVRR
ncbi:MAG: DUF3604 domain-containing protein [Planctomycetota bacterium]